MNQTLRTTPALGISAIGKRVVQILAAQALRDPDGISHADSIDALGIDSLGMAEVIFAIEEEFDVAVPFNGTETDSRGMDLTTVAGVIAAVEALVHLKGVTTQAVA